MSRTESNNLKKQSRWKKKQIVSFLLGIIIAAIALVLFVLSPSTLFIGTAFATPNVAPGQSATLLPSGQFLLLGGRGTNNQPLNEAWLFDPHTNQRQRLATQLRDARADHSATVLPDGRVLVLGGTGANGGGVLTVETFDLASGRFSLIENVALTPRSGHAAAILTDGRLLLAGGSDGERRLLGNAEVWNPRTGQITALGQDPLLLRSIATTRLLTDGSVLFVGGRDANARTVSNALLFRPEEGKFQEISNAEASQLAAAVEQVVVPQLVASNPSSGANNFPMDGVLAVRFAGPIDVATVNERTFVLVGPQGQVDTKIVPAQEGMLVFVTPRQELIPGANYTLFVDDLSGRTGVKHALEALDFKVASQSGSARSGSALPTSTGTGGVALGANAAAAGQIANAVAGQDDADDDEVFVPGEEHHGGRWRTGRPLPESVTALLDLDPRFRDKIAAQRARATRTGATVKASALTFTPKYAKGATGVAGMVLRLNDRPLANVSVSIGTRTTRTDESGRFELIGIAPGHHVMVIDGGNAGKGGRKYAEVSYGADIQAGQVTELTHAIFLPRIREKDWVNVSIPTRTDTVVTHPDIPGFEIQIPQGAVIRDRHGKIVNRIAIVPVPVDRTPFPLPGNFPMYFMVQPSGAVVQGLDPRAPNGIRVVYPNHTKEKSGTEARYWLYDPHGSGWRVYGTARVSDDARRVVPEAGAYLPQNMLGGYTMNTTKPGGAPTGGCGDGCCGGGGGGGGGGNGGKYAGDPVDCSTGIFIHQRTDVTLRDVVPLSLTRTYRTKDSYTRPFGIGGMHDFDMNLYDAIGTTHGANNIQLILPDGQWLEYVYTPRTDGLYYVHNSSPGRFYSSTLLNKGPDSTQGGYSLRLRDGTVYGFNIYGELAKIINRNGSRIDITRNSGTIQRITTENGRYIDFTNDFAGRITRLVDISGRTWNYTYNTAGYLSRATYPDNTYEEYTYDTAGRMLTVRDRRGNTMVTNVYDANGRVQQQTLADGGVFQFAYVTDASGKVTQTDITDPRGFVNRATFNSAGYPLTDTYAFGRPEQQGVTIERQAGTNLMLSRTDALGRKTTYTYDARGNVTSTTRLAGTANAVTETFTYEPLYSQIASYTNALGKQTINTYDTQGLLTTIRDPVGNEVGMTYNGTGQVASFTVGGNTTRYTYDLGDRVSVTDPLNRITGYYPDMLGRTLSITDPALQRTRFEYNTLDQITKETDALGNVTQKSYDPLGNLLSVTDPKGGLHQYSYDAKNRLLTQTDPLNRLESYQYDGNNNRTSLTDRKGQITTFTYDALNRRTLTTYADSSTVTATYDAMGRLTQAVDSISGTITRGYDGLNQLTLETVPQGSLSYSYDAASRRTGMTVAGQPAITYGYDDANRLTAITQGTTSVGFTYDTANRRATLMLPSGIVATYSYDAASQLTGITYKQGATTVGDLVYTYDTLGNRTQTSGSLARTNQPVAITNATYNAANQLNNWNGSSITYDNNGNMLSDGTRTYTWDARNRLASITGPTSASFQYDAFGRRAQKTVAGANTRYLYDGPNPVQELNGTTPTANLLTGEGIDEFFRRTDSAGSRDFLTDALGTVLALADSAGVVQTSYTYEPFGNKSVSGAANSNSFQYTGRENDGTGLYYFRARYYNPTLQRFISSDPIGLEGGLNTYAYVENNPLSYVDPDGLRFRDIRPAPRRPSPSQEDSQNRARCLNGQCPTPDDFQYPSTPGPYLKCEWTCPKNPQACSNGDPNPNDGLTGIPGLFPGAPGCVYRCTSGPFLER
jgi:RHS repeat-associated protein